MATRVSLEPLSFEVIAEKIRQVSAKKVLATAVLTGNFGDREVRILAHLLRCRPSGFMVMLPVLEEVQGVLDQLVDEEGTSLFVSREVDVPLEDSAGRKFGVGAMALVDFVADCAAQFARTPALRGAASAGLLRMTVRGAVARPASRGVLQLAAAWIDEMAEIDENLQKYFTGEDGEGLPEPSASGAAYVEADVVQQLQARIAQLEAQAGARTLPSVAPVVDLEPRPHGPGRSVLFSPSSLEGTVDRSTL